ncbi:DUF1810 family protein [Leptolyngbya sp. 7M]|uniref:DUF1810 family protein n=1 Tax=Leptolyngbya sp. 7M TaxID=2812896 RepID=UPI001B8BB1F1|nr:DUF1810 family protein [Leptolyngbya sp. 7M]QYO65298.1 DUF1810 family protein [Leptolyngbya sp. 7M]
MTDTFDLKRFIEAQVGIYDAALSELRTGRKRSHWMWFIFPQIDGLGTSDTSRRFAIKSLEEAREYLGHPILGNRLRECAQVMIDLEGKSASEIFGYPDDLKFRSSMTLFSFLEGNGSIFRSVIDKYFGGEADNRTLEILNRLGAARINTAPRLPESLDFRVFAERVAKGGREKCGDSFAVEFLEQDQILVLAVADGVSSSPCDWKASETACEAILGRFKSAGGSIAQRMENAALKAHNAVLQVGGRCAGSITSLTFVVWPITSDEIYVLNVGDSRVYAGPDNALEQITSDDVQPVVLKRNGEVVLQAGVPVFMRGVTRSVGQIEALEFSVQTHPFRSNDVLLLVSDGISKNEAFTSGFPRVFGSASIGQGLSQLVAESAQRNKDDATMIAVWRSHGNTAVGSIYEDCLVSNSDFRSAGVSATHIVEIIKSDLLNKIGKNKNDEVNVALDYASNFGIRFDRDFLSDLLRKVIRQGTDRPLIARLRDLIRRAHTA